MTPNPKTEAAAKSPLVELADQGQSLWLDTITRQLMDSGELALLIERDGLRGMTSNPAIFEKAITSGEEYRGELQRAGRRCATHTKAVYEDIAIADIRRAADAFLPVYRATDGRDGFVSLEVSPHLARDARGTADEARRLWKRTARPNVMIKVPGTSEGLPAVRELLAEGIHVNITLLFSVETYRRVAEVHLAALEDLRARGGDVSRVASVASFFVSRIDTAVDRLLAEKAKSAGSEAERELARHLAGKAAVANAKLAYQAWLELVETPRWKALAAAGARPQRLLWASTGTKDPRYADTLYVDELIGRETVNTVPRATWDAFRDHGRVRPSLTEDVIGARETLALLWQLGISLEEVTTKLLDEGLALFEEAFDRLLAAIAARFPSPGSSFDTRMSTVLPEGLTADVDATLRRWTEQGAVARLWKKDAGLWTGGDESRWLGWLDVVAEQQRDAARFASFAAEVRDAGFTHVLLLGMGGSSLGAEVLAGTFGRLPGAPALHVLDSTDPAQVASTEAKLDLARTLFLVASKSGSTLEPNIFQQHFFERVAAAVGRECAGRQFVAITDPGSKMQQVAEARGFRRVFFGEPSIGGRYSALSDFGMVPAALIGVDVPRFLDRAERMAKACGPDVPPARNPGVQLGIVLGSAARAGRDKLTLLTSPGIRGLGAWLEQLLAESTGKAGRGVIPVDLEALAGPDAYGKDRLFVALRLESETDPGEESALSALEDAGHPVVRITLRDAYDLAGEFFRWEMATAVAGAVLGIHPFDQPDVEASKVETRKLSEAFERTGSLPPESPVLVEGNIRLFTDSANAEVLRKAGAGSTLSSFLRAHFARLEPGDYAAVLAYVEKSARHEALLQDIRHALRDAKRVATCLGFGPRFLHSTGQAYKGGPATGLFLQVTCDDARDLPVPDQRYTFGVVKSAQARGDFTVLAERGRRALRVHLGADVADDLDLLRRAVRAALSGPVSTSARRHPLAMIGLGRMGANMARRLLRAGHEVVACDATREPVDALARDGAKAAYTLAEAIRQMPGPRILWVMVPSGEPTEKVVRELADLAQPGDLIVDGGNSHFKDDVRRAKELGAKGIRYADVGTSGGIWGLERGYCLMAGATDEAFALLEPVLETLAPGRGDVKESAGRDARVSTAARGYLHCGPVGAGHFVKMIHNGIEYGMMQAYAEGFDILKSAARPDAPAGQRYDFDLADVAELWRRGSVVGSWLLDLTAMALAEDPKLEGYTGYVQDSGEGRWTVLAAVEEAVPADVLTASLYARFRSRQDHTFAERLLSAMRAKFGGHTETPRKE
jgi:transaldolase/glucose-6-phosphate isomerase